MTAEELARRIDHTILKPETTTDQVHRVVAEALEYEFASVCVSPLFVRKVAIELAGSRVKTCAVAGFPTGAQKATIKAVEAVSVVKDGAQEVDTVAHLPYLADHDVESARAELIEIVRAARAVRKDVVIKVIIESAYLMSLGADRGEGAIATACQAIRESGCDYVKTATGFHPSGGATVDAVKLMKKHAEGILVKAAGGIRDAATAMAMIDAGADRIGCSASVAVVKELASRG